ncbi:FT-interacting protein 4-like [Miscanthus floridulus]|uniref:FT-interacting protein 4-like n=1 Tax=Miscanthus floridulus TaxID=154761 RepID=UPI003457C28C
MATSYLVVHVVDANFPSSSNSNTSYYVELRFNGQSARTETKEDAVWNQTIRFHMRDEQQGDDDGDDHPSASGGGLDLEAAVYSIDETSSSESLLGKAVVDKKDFDSHSSKAGLFPHDLLKILSGDDDPVLTRSREDKLVVNGKLTLKVFHSAADDKALFEIEDDNRARQTEDGGDKVNKIFKYLFSSKDHRYGEEDKNKTSGVDVGNNTTASSSNNENNNNSSSTSSTALQHDDDISPRRIEPRFEDGKVVERMQFLFVVVVKARGLPDVDAYGRLDPFVEVNFGAYNKGITKCLKRDDNPEWNKTFAFSLKSGKAPPSSFVDVVVKDGDLVRDEFVGKLYFYLKDIPTRHPDHDEPEPTWHPLLDERGKATLGKASLLLAIWIGSQADEAYRHAWESPYGPKVYENPRLWCLRVTIVEVQGVVACDEDEAADGGGARARSLKDELFCKACLGDQVQKTRPAAKTMQTTSSGSYEWRDGDDLVFIAAQPFFESNLQVYVVAASSLSFGRQEQEEEVIGQLSIPLAQIDRLDVAAYGHYDPIATHAPQWFDLKNPHPHSSDAAASVVDHQGGFFGANLSHMRIRLRTLLDGGYHIGHDPQGYLDDTRPAERQLWEPPIGRLHLGILRATGLRRHIEGGDTRSGGRSSAAQLKPYCVAKYGDKWVRTRTIIESSDPVFNEQYTWDVYDIATVLNVGVFDHCTVRASSAHHRIGKVRIRLSTLETDRVYAHAYSLVTLSPSGPIKTGELHLALKISLPSIANMLRMYVRPTLPRMHYVQPLNEEQEDFFATVGSSDDTNGKLWSHAANILALRLDRIEPPLSKEVVAYMCNVESCNNNSFSMRRSKANFLRLIAVLFPVIFAPLRWFDGVRSWRNPLVTLLIHAILVLALWFRQLVLPLVLVYIALVGVWNYRYRPRRPTYIDLCFSHVYMVQPDELDEEFDTYPTSQRDDGLVRLRYDRLRSIAGRVQTVVGDMASQFERIQSLLSWRDPIATAIFMLLLLIAAAMAYFLPYKKLLLAVPGFYIMRHPRLRTRTKPSIFLCFLRRLPAKDMLLM